MHYEYYLLFICWVDMFIFFSSIFKLLISFIMLLIYLLKLLLAFTLAVPFSTFRKIFLKAVSHNFTKGFREYNNNSDNNAERPNQPISQGTSIHKYVPNLTQWRKLKSSETKGSNKSSINKDKRLLKFHQLKNKPLKSKENCNSIRMYLKGLGLNPRPSPNKKIKMKPFSKKFVTQSKKLTN